jgi:hypothetical protein
MLCEPLRHSALVAFLIFKVVGVDSYLILLKKKQPQNIFGVCNLLLILRKNYWGSNMHFFMQFIPCFVLATDAYLTITHKYHQTI